MPNSADAKPIALPTPNSAVRPGSWLRAADEVSLAGMRLKFRTGGLEEHLFPPAHALARWIVSRRKEFSGAN